MKHKYTPIAYKGGFIGFEEAGELLGIPYDSVWRLYHRKKLITFEEMKLHVDKYQNGKYYYVVYEDNDLELPLFSGYIKDISKFFRLPVERITNKFCQSQIDRGSGKGRIYNQKYKEWYRIARFLIDDLEKDLEGGML